MKNLPHIFISYSYKDRSLVEKSIILLTPLCPKSSRLQRLARANALGNFAGAAHTDVADWSREIAFVLADCGVVCLMWSQHAARER